MLQTTICFLVDSKSNLILLGLKKRGFREGKFNGFGGKLEENESVEENVIREE